jgi:hypothetical protein
MNKSSQNLYTSGGEPINKANVKVYYLWARREIKQERVSIINKGQEGFLGKVTKP